jgi:outer membrane protein assembly factor BamB
VFASIYVIYKQPSPDPLPTTILDEITWTANYENHGNIVNQPILFDETIYIQTESEVLAYNAFTGEVIWESDIPLGDPDTQAWSPIPMEIDQTRVVVQSQRNTLVAFDRENGSLLWEWKNSRTKSYIFISDVSFYDNMLLISSHNSDISAINISDETLIWRNNNVPSRTKLNLFPLDGKIFLASTRDIIVFDPNNGQIVQSYSLDGFADSYSIDNDNLYITYDSGDCTFVSFSLRLMQNDWCVNVEFDFLLNNIESVYDSSNVYFFGNRMFAIDKNTGTLLWETASESFFKNPVILSDFIYVSDGRYLYKINSLNGMKTLKIAIPLYAENNTTGLNWKPIVTPDLIITFSNSEITAYKNKFK